jgi:hypothetical protein
VVEKAGGFGADEPAALGAALHRSGLERSEQGLAYPAKPRVGRDVVEKNLAVVGNRTDRDDDILLDCCEHRGVGPRNPRRDVFGVLLLNQRARDAASL